MMEVQKSAQRKALLYPSAQVYDWGTTLVVAPYPDYQIVGCGGAIALLRQMGYRVRTLFMGDGRSALRHEQPMTVAERRKIAVQESIEAMACLGISEEASTYLQLSDELIPQQGEPGFEESVRLVINELQVLEPDTVLLPLLTHDHTDLLATWQIVREALRQFPSSVMVVEYPLLDAQIFQSRVAKPTAEHQVWRLDVKEMLDRKVSALQLFQNTWAGAVSALEAIQSWEVYVQYQE